MYILYALYILHIYYIQYGLFMVYGVYNRTSGSKTNQSTGHFRTWYKRQYHLQAGIL